MVVDLGRVMPRDRNARKEPAKQGGAGLGQLVQDETAPGELGEDGEKAGAGRRLQHEIGGVIAAAVAAAKPSAIGVENC